MILHPDDEIYVIDQRWYGPPGRELPFHARYAAYGWGLVFYVLAMLIERVVLRVDVSPQSVLFTLLFTALATTYVMKKVDPERPMATVIRSYWHELSAPRPCRKPTKGSGTRMHLARPVRASLPSALEAQLATHLETD